MKQKILVVDDRVRSMLKHDTDESFLKKQRSLCIKVSLGLTVALIVVWPTSFFLFGNALSSTEFHIWVTLAILWAFAAASVIIILPLVEARTSIGTIFHRVNTGSKQVLRKKVSSIYEIKTEDFLKLLVPINGSVNSLKALNHANYLLRDIIRVKIFVVNIIEWSMEEEDNIEEELSTKMIEEGRKMLRSVLVPRQINTCERIVKLGDPPSKIAELAKKLDVDMIVMGKKGLGNTDSNLGHVTSKLLQLTNKPVVLIN